MTKDFSFIVLCDSQAFVSFIQVLSEKQVVFNDHNIIQKGVTPSDSSSVIEIISALSSFGLAGIFITWLKQKYNRKVKIIKSDNTLEVITSGYSAKDIETIIENANHISLLEKSNSKD